MSLSDFQCFSSQKLTSPGAMNWRGVWGIPGVYQYGDVVEGPDGEGYVCIDLDGNIGNTPGTSPAVWQLLSSGTATAVSLSSVNGSGITVAEPTTNNFTVATNLVAGSGISLTPSGVNTSLTVGNSGVLSVSAGTGISVGGTAQNPSIANGGVLGITSGSAAITVGGTAQNPVITQAYPSTSSIVDVRFPGPGVSAPITGTIGVNGNQIGSIFSVVPGATYSITISATLVSTANSNGAMSIGVAPTAFSGAGAAGQAYDMVVAVESTVQNGGSGSVIFTVPAPFSNYGLFVAGFGTTGTITASVFSAYLTRIS